MAVGNSAPDTLVCIEKVVLVVHVDCLVPIESGSRNDKWKIRSWNKMPGTESTVFENIYYPVSLNIKGRQCLVIGGGPIAHRKVVSLIECGAIVTVVSPELCLEMSALADEGKIRIISRDYRQGDLQGVFVVIAATDNPGINRQVANEAREKSAVVNVVDDASNS